MRKFVLPLGLGALLVAGGFMIDRPSVQAQDAEKAEPKPVLDTYGTMELLFQPHFETLQTAMQSEPADRRGWVAILDSANALAELSNLLFFRDDADYTASEEWAAMTLDTRQKAADMAATVRTQDFAQVDAKYTALVESCNKCHTHFEPDIAPVLLKTPEAPAE